MRFQTNAFYDWTLSIVCRLIFCGSETTTLSGISEALILNKQTKLNFYNLRGSHMLLLLLPEEANVFSITPISGELVALLVDQSCSTVICLR